MKETLPIGSTWQEQQQLVAVMRRYPSRRLRIAVLVLLVGGLSWLMFGWCTRDGETSSEGSANRFRVYGLPMTAWIRYDTRTYNGGRAFVGPVVATSHTHRIEGFGLTVDMAACVLAVIFGFGLFEWTAQKILNRARRLVAEPELLTMPLGPPPQPPPETEWEPDTPGWDEVNPR